MEVKLREYGKCPMSGCARMKMLGGLILSNLSKFA
ncbi:hypothetical protein TcasGA2_TC034931 [Tribolium castaneum]|uniref:Uncharacterized protein n=1 Tax=Tribolium castaneum TaxID=7070 RepID=A0A139WA82_TRICA|nr:hypothetical protein TcasGA2_TC034931 [Tribolium castaneum]